MRLKSKLTREYYYLKEYLRLAQGIENVDVWWLNRFLILESIFNPSVVERFNQEMEADGNQITVQWCEIKLITLHIINGFDKSQPHLYSKPLRETHHQTMLSINYPSSCFDTACDYYGENWLRNHSISYKEIFRSICSLKAA